jgi:hypothetical protein
MWTIAGGIILAALILGVVTLGFSAMSHWFGSADARNKQRAWESEMEAKRNG